MVSFSCELGLLVVTLLHIRAQRANDALQVDAQKHLFITLSFCCSFVACLGNILGAKRMLLELRRALTAVNVTARGSMQFAKRVRGFCQPAQQHAVVCVWLLQLLSQDTVSMSCLCFSMPRTRHVERRAQRLTIAKRASAISAEPCYCSLEPIWSHQSTSSVALQNAQQPTARPLCVLDPADTGNACSVTEARTLQHQSELDGAGSWQLATINRADSNVHVGDAQHAEAEIAAASASALRA